MIRASFDCAENCEVKRKGGNFAAKVRGRICCAKFLAAKLRGRICCTKFLAAEARGRICCAKFLAAKVRGRICCAKFLATKVRERICCAKFLAANPASFAKQNSVSRAQALRHKYAKTTVYGFSSPEECPKTVVDGFLSARKYPKTVRKLLTTSLRECGMIPL